MRCGVAATLGLLLLSCGEGGLRVTIAQEGGVALEALRVRVVATERKDPLEPGRCFVEEHSLDSGELDFPIVVVVFPGSSPWSCVAVGLDGFDAAGEEEIRAEALFCPDLDGLFEETITLSSTCCASSGPPPCREDEICRGVGGEGRCVASAAAPLLERESCEQGE